MINTQADIRNDVLVQSNLSTTAGFVTDSMLNTWESKAHTWAAGLHKWPFTEARQSTTWTGAEEVGYPEGWRPDSIRIVTVGGERMEKTNFEDYLLFKENRPEGNDRIFSDYNGTLFFNTVADVSGTITMYGQYLPAKFDATATDTNTTVFSGAAEEGNEAIVEEVMSYVKKRQKKYDEAKMHHENAMLILELLWSKVQKEQYKYQTKDRSMWKRFDVMAGGFRDDIFNRDQFNLS